MHSNDVVAKVKRITIKVLIAAVALAIVGSALYTFATLEFSYSEGERVGFVQKLSKKGWICKTNEGELAMVNVVGQQATIFNFSVRDESVVTAIEALAGHKLTLHYAEHRGIPSTCFGETTYFVTGVTKAD
jgi:hypothetical protein